jgi:HSP20 family protein
MSKIIRKIAKPSESTKDQHLVKQAIGWQMQVRSKVWSPPTDLYETENEYIVRMEIAGMREAVISGSRPDVQERCAYHQMEIRCGRFSSAISLPSPVDLENATASYEDGFFVATLPKLKPSQIMIQEE